MNFIASFYSTTLSFSCSVLLRILRNSHDMSAGHEFFTCGSLPHELELMSVGSPIFSFSKPEAPPASISEVSAEALKKVPEEEISVPPPAPESLWRTAWNLLYIALPICISYFSQLAVFQIALRYAGTMLGVEALAGASMGIMYCNCFGFSVIFGMANALDTLLFQAHGADPKSPLIMLYVQRAILILLLLTIPITAVWVFADPVLRLTGQKPEVAAMAGTYILYNLANLPLCIFYEVLRKFLMCVHNLTAVVLVSILLTGLSPFMFYGLIQEQGIAGCPLTITMFFLGMVIFTVGYIALRGSLHRGLWHGFSFAAFKDWKQFLLLGIPSALMLFLEWGVFELNGLASGRLGVETLDTMSICMQVLSLLYMLPLGLNVAVSITVGNALGARNIPKARRAALATSILMAGVATVDIVVLWFTQDVVPGFFNGDPELLRLYREVMPLLIVFHILDSILCVCNGIVKGMGYPKYGFYFLFAAYAIGVPLGWVFAFKLGMRFRGLWLGPVLGLIGGALGYVVFFQRVRWEHAESKAMERIRHSERILGGNGREKKGIEISS